MPDIYFLSHNQIDKIKWDHTISESVCSLIYARSWYLDISNPGWEALIYGDYEYIMPLPVKFKFGLKYIVQPVLTKQLGIFSSTDISPEIIDKFLKILLKRFKYIRLNLNRCNNLINASDVVIRKYLNHEIDLSAGYGNISKNYKRRAIRNIKKGNETGLEFREINDGMNAVEFCYGEIEQRHNIKKEKEILFYKNLISSGKATFKYYGSYFQNSLLAVCIFIFDANRIYFMTTGSNEEGKQLSASFHLIDSFLQKYAGNDKILDFTGSSLKNIQFFNEGFGAVPFSYQYIQYTNYKFPLNLIIKQGTKF